MTLTNMACTKYKQEYMAVEGMMLSVGNGVTQRVSLQASVPSSHFSEGYACNNAYSRQKLY